MDKTFLIWLIWNEHWSGKSQGILKRRLHWRKKIANYKCLVGQSKIFKRMPSIQVIGNCCSFHFLKKSYVVIVGYEQKSQPTKGPTNTLYFPFFLCTVKPSFFAFPGPFQINAHSELYQIPNSSLSQEVWLFVFRIHNQRPVELLNHFTLAKNVSLFSTQYFVIAKRTAKENFKCNIIKNLSLLFLVLDRYTR